MKRMMISLAASLALPAMALAQAPDQSKQNNPNAAAGAASEQAVPEMKNPGGTENLHPPQKAMDQATEGAPGKSDSSTGASSGESGQSETWNANDNKGGDLKKPPMPDSK